MIQVIINPKHLASTCLINTANSFSPFWNVFGSLVTLETLLCQLALGLARVDPVTRESGQLLAAVVLVVDVVGHIFKVLHVSPEETNSQEPQKSPQDICLQNSANSPQKLCTCKFTCN